MGFLINFQYFFFNMSRQLRIIIRLWKIFEMKDRGERNKILINGKLYGKKMLNRK